MRIAAAMLLLLFSLWCVYLMYREGIRWKDTWNYRQPLHHTTIERIRRATQAADQDR